MRFRRKLKRTTRQYIIVALICITVIGTVAISTSIIMIGQIRGEYEYMLDEARREMEANRKSVYIALSDINKGEILNIDMVEQKTVFTSQPDECHISEDDLGKAVMIDIPQGTHIVKGMMARHLVSSVLREVEYDVIHPSMNITTNDYVDVRIFYPNGENFIVLSKKSLKGFQPGTPICYLWVDEEELLRMSAAIVDAGLYQGSRLYMTKYIEPNIQDASTITYTPNVEVLSLIENDPNIVDRCSQILNIEVRMALENRLAERFNLDVSTISWNLDDIEIRYMPEMTAIQSIDETDRGRDSDLDIGIGVYRREDKVGIKAEDKDKVEDKDKSEGKDIAEDKDNIETSETSYKEHGQEIEINIGIEDDGRIRYFPELGNQIEDSEKHCYMATEG